MARSADFARYVAAGDVNGKQALRPMLCSGPKDSSKEWTVLARAKKKDNDTSEEKTAAATAAIRREEIHQGTRARRIFGKADKS